MAYRVSQDEIRMTSVLGRKLTTPTLDVLHPSHFAYRHIGPRRADVEEMLELLGYESLEQFIDAVVPEEIRLRRPLALPPGRSEREVLQALRGLAGMNTVFRSYIGMGYAGTFTPQVVQRNVLENPGWYTAYTPYQAEISQGRLEALLNFQTVVSDLTALPIASASLLDEATAAAEAMQLTVATTSARGPFVTGATGLRALALLTPPGEWGADIAVGNSQRFGVPMGYGGPHAAFFATREAYKRFMPGRIIGVSRDRDGRPALRMALQTREQHIRRDKATSNVCTAQVLLAVMASMYAVYHGPSGLRRIAERVHTRTVLLANALRRLRYRVVHEAYFDTICVEVEGWALPRLLDAARVRNINLRPLSATRLCIALDETVTLRNGNVAVHQATGIAGPVAHLRHDSTRLLHDEAERHDRDDAGQLARVQPASSICAPGPGGRLPAPLQSARVSAGGDHRLRSRVAPAERRLAG